MAKKDKDKAPAKAVEAWAKELNTPLWLFAAAKAKFRWPEGQLLTRAEYERALRATESEVVG